VGESGRVEIGRRETQGLVPSNVGKSRDGSLQQETGAVTAAVAKVQMMILTPPSSIA
jgi:hypothetical protein